MLGSEPTRTPAKRAPLPSASSFAISSRRTGPAVPLDVVLVVRVVTRLVRIEPVPEIRTFLPGKMKIEMQHHRHVVLARRGECTANDAGQSLLEFKGRRGEAEA